MSNPVPRLRRLLAIIPLIQRRGGISLRELQETLGVSKRELEKDLNAIMLCGVPPYLPNDYISVFIDNDHVTVDYAEHFARPARLTLSEALALRLAIERLPLPEEGPLYDAAIELLEVLDRQMRKSGEGNMAALEGRIEASRDEDQASRVAPIEEAIQRRVPLELTYYSASSDQVTPRCVLPYGLVSKAGNHYLVGFCERKQTVLSFRLDRMANVRQVEGASSFEVPPGFDLAAHAERIGARPDGGYRVRLRFKQELSRFVEDDFPGCRIERAGDGEGVLELPCNSIPWAVSKALLYGELVEVLEPPEARAQLVERLQTFLSQGRQD